jgi:hypothetical protein
MGEIGGRSRFGGICMGVWWERSVDRQSVGLLDRHAEATAKALRRARDDGGEGERERLRDWE